LQGTRGGGVEAVWYKGRVYLIVRENFTTVVKWRIITKWMCLLLQKVVLLCSY
jgi:hypothetical protein